MAKNCRNFEEVASENLKICKLLLTSATLDFQGEVILAQQFFPSHVNTEI